MLVEHRVPPTWRLYTGLCKFAQNISMDIWSLGKCRDPKLGEVSSLPVSCNIKISWLHPLNSFQFIFWLHHSENHLYSWISTNGHQLQLQHTGGLYNGHSFWSLQTVNITISYFNLSITATFSQWQRSLKCAPIAKITTQQRPVNQRLTNSVYKTQFIVKGHQTWSVPCFAGLCFCLVFVWLISFDCATYSWYAKISLF